MKPIRAQVSPCFTGSGVGTLVSLCLYAVTCDTVKYLLLLSWQGCAGTRRKGVEAQSCLHSFSLSAESYCRPCALSLSLQKIPKQSWKASFISLWWLECCLFLRKLRIEKKNLVSRGLELMETAGSPDMGLLSVSCVWGSSVWSHSVSPPILSLGSG